MPLPGGAADKFGNRYEGRWTVSCMLDVMDERADSIRLEPPGAEGEGAEFWVRKRDDREYHQVKRQHSTGRWTLPELDKEEVPARFAEKLLNDPSAWYVFVSSHAAYQLEELADRARGSASWEEFDREFLRADQKRKDFDRLCQPLGHLSKADVFHYLRRIRVETVSENHLRNMIESRIWTLVEGDPATIANVLAELALDKVHYELTAQDIWLHLEDQGFHRRRWDNDPHILPAIEGANERYLGPLRNQAISGRVIPRDEVQSVHGLLKSPGPKTGVLVTGEAGAGKSGVMLQIVDELLARGIPVLAFRADRLQPTQLPDNIGQQLGLPGSPASVLAAIAQGKESVLVIDQLDALSLASGRNTEVFDCIDEILRQAQAHPNVRVLLACRKFDLDNDHRLRRLTGPEGIAEAIAVNRLSDQTVQEVVSELGLDAGRLNTRQLELLSVPLHLKLLSEISKDSGVDVLNFQTVKDLYDHFWEYKQRIIEHERLGRQVQWTQVIYTLCDYMNEHQSLTAPELVLEDWSRDAEAIASENVLVHDGKQFAFFHEGFFDYAYARRFVRNADKLSTFLLRDEQHLFRRAQVRQILLLLREADFGRYIDDLKEVLTSPDVRFHLKQVVFALLTELSDPMEEEWDVLSHFVREDASDPRRQQVWAILRSSAPWFQLVDSLGWIQTWLADADDAFVDQTVWHLRGVQRQLPDRVAELVDPHVGESEQWNKRLLFLSQWADLSRGRRFMDLFLRLIDEGVLDEARGPRCCQ